MKIITGIFLAATLLSACANAETDSSIASKYGLTAEQVKEMRAAAEGMGMDMEDHLQSLGFAPKE